MTLPGQIKIMNYRPFPREGSAIKAHFTIEELPSTRRINQCREMETNGRTWFSMPQEEKKDPEGGKSKYYAYVTFGDKEIRNQYEKMVLAALALYKENPIEDPQEHELPPKQNGRASQVSKSPVFGQSQALW